MVVPGDADARVGGLGGVDEGGGDGDPVGARVWTRGEARLVAYSRDVWMDLAEAVEGRNVRGLWAWC